MEPDTGTAHQLASPSCERDTPHVPFWYRRAARGLMAVGASCLLAAFTLRVSAELRVTAMLSGAAVLELGGLLALRSRGPVTGLRIKPPAYAHVAAMAIAAAYIGLTLAGNPSVWANIMILAPMKLLAVGAALIAGFFEETLFRGILMDRLRRAGRGAFVQILLSGLLFGALHFYAFAGLEAALVAQAATTLLGWMLAGLYLLSGRSLWPCVVAHAVIDAVLEPALLLSFTH